VNAQFATFPLGANGSSTKFVSCCSLAAAGAWQTYFKQTLPDSTIALLTGKAR